MVNLSLFQKARMSHVIHSLWFGEDEDQNIDENVLNIYNATPDQYLNPYDGMS